MAPAQRLQLPLRLADTADSRPDPSAGSFRAPQLALGRLETVQEGTRDPKLCAAHAVVAGASATLRLDISQTKCEPVGIHIWRLAGLVCALLGVFVWQRLRPAAPGWMESYDEIHIAAFEQWPTTAFVLDPVTQRILAANPAGLRNTGYTLEEFWR